MNAQSQNNTTKNYSWLKRGQSCSIKNIHFVNSINMISAIASNGTSLWYFKVSKTTSIEIIKFLKTLFKLMKITNEIENQKLELF